MRIPGEHSHREARGAFQGNIPYRKSGSISDREGFLLESQGCIFDREARGAFLKKKQGSGIEFYRKCLIYFYHFILEDK
jgi:hypothetical protein